MVRLPYRFVILKLMHNNRTVSFDIYEIEELKWQGSLNNDNQ
jgi:hypothetical protein